MVHTASPVLPVLQAQLLAAATKLVIAFLMSVVGESTSERRF